MLLLLLAPSPPALLLQQPLRPLRLGDIALQQPRLFTRRPGCGLVSTPSGRSILNSEAPLRPRPRVAGTMMTPSPYLMMRAAETKTTILDTMKMLLL